MGRRAKHLTSSAKALAKRNQAKEYRATSSGRQAQSKENHAQYTRRQAERNTLLGQPVPPELLTRAKKALCASLAVQDDGPLLGLWTPPYEFDRPDYILLRRLGKQTTGGRWDTTVGLLGGLQYNELVELCWGRYELWKNTEVTEDIADVTPEVTARIQAWMALKSSEVANEDREAKEVALDWGAKIVCILVEEWEARTQDGLSGYTERGRTGSLPWQRMMKEVLRMYN